MEAYQINSNCILIKDGTLLYCFTGFKFIRSIVVDLFQISKDKLIYQKVFQSECSAEPLNKTGTKAIEIAYPHLKNFPKINPKQLLTHQNPFVREIIRKILNEKS